MPLFAKKPAEPADPDLVAVAIRSSEGKLLIAETLIAANQAGISACLKPGERPVCASGSHQRPAGVE